MSYDNLIKCERCEGDACYAQEVNESITNYMCYGCGFQTNTLMKKGEEFFEQQMETLPDLYKELMGEDDEGKVPVKEEEKEKYPIPNKKGEYYEWRMDMSTITHYDEKDFVDALDFIGIFDKQEIEE